MTTEADALLKIVLAASRKGVFRSRPVFKPHRKTLPSELLALEQKLGIPLPAELRDWLLAAGYGDIDEVLSFREDWFNALSSGPLEGGVVFAQDDLGNFYAFDARGRIYFLDRSEPVFGMLASDFSSFLKELIDRDYKLGDWTDTLETQPCTW